LTGPAPPQTEWANPFVIMKAKLSKEVVQRKRDGMFVLSSITQHGRKVAASVLRMLMLSVAGNLEGEAGEPDVWSVLNALGERLLMLLERLSGIDQQLRDALATLGILRKTRDDKAEKVGEQVVGLRRIVTGNYPHALLDALGLQPLVEEEPFAVQHRTEAIGQAFLRDDVGQMLGSPTFQDEPDPRNHAAEIASNGEALKVSVQDVRNQERQVEDIRRTKNEAMKEYDETFLRSARVFEDFSRLAGMGALADRVRPSDVHRGRTEQSAANDPPGSTGGEVADTAVN
jgi:hypothetical protein